MANVEAGPGLVLAAGTMTFANEWWQTDKPNFRVVVATLIGAGLAGLLAEISPKGSAALGGIIMIGALTTKFNGNSPVTELNSILNAKPGAKRPPARKAK